MPEQTPITLEQVGQLIAEAMKPISTQMMALQTSVSKAVTAEQLSQAIEGQKAGLGELVTTTVTNQFAAANADHAKNAGRSKYISEKMADIPEPYLAKFGTDPTKFAADEQTIRAAYKADLAKAGVKATDLGGGTGGNKPAGTIDTSKMSGMELINLGVQQTKGSATAASAAAASGADASATAAK